MAKRGFGSPRYDKAKHKAAASKGGRVAHALGVAREWTKEEAKEAGRRGGLARARAREED